MQLRLLIAGVVGGLTLGGALEAQAFGITGAYPTCYSAPIQIAPPPCAPAFYGYAPPPSAPWVRPQLPPPPPVYAAPSYGYPGYGYGPDRGRAIIPPGVRVTDVPPDLGWSYASAQPLSYAPPAYGGSSYAYAQPAPPSTVYADTSYRPSIPVAGQGTFPPPPEVQGWRDDVATLPNWPRPQLPFCGPHMGQVGHCYVPQPPYGEPALAWWDGYRVVWIPGRG